MTLTDFYKKHAHLWWIVLLVVAGIFFAIYAVSMIGTLFAHLFCWALFAGVLYAADFHTLKWLNDHKLQFAVALVASIIWAIWQTKGLLNGVVLGAWDVLIIMVVFSLSAVIWPNAETIAQRAKDLADGKADPLATLREAGRAGADAVSRGARTAVDEGSRLGDHFRGTKPAA